jgi:hypothetical protein
MSEPNIDFDGEEIQEGLYEGQIPHELYFLIKTAQGYKARSIDGNEHDLRGAYRHLSRIKNPANFCEKLKKESQELKTQLQDLEAAIAFIEQNKQS